MILAPLLCIFFFTSLMSAGLPKRLPAAIVDEDNTHVTRIIIRILNSFEETDLSTKYHSFTEARRAVQRGEIYAFFYIPKGTTRGAESSRQPKISFYTNDAYLVPANLLMKDMKTASELISLALTRESLYGNGYTEEEAMGVLQPIVIETHPLNNPYLDYSVYLSNMLVPGIMILLILLTTTYTIGFEWKQKSHKLLYQMAGRSQTIALTGKLLPQTSIYCTMMIFMDVWFFKFQAYPCHCGIGLMILISILTVLASQAFGIFLFGLMAGEMRLAMCICSLWGILSFSLAGFTYPVTAMDPILRALAVWFPLRHYYLIYVNSALNGYPLQYVWWSVAALILFCALPLLVLPRYRKAFLKYEYIK
ncbi:MAG: ABC transporter permease [Prevotella sp.]|nr:ABC transporter permease [Prevotella sp.]